MRKLLVLALSALLVLGLASVSFAAATLSGEIDVKIVGNNSADSKTSTSADEAFGKMVLNGKLGDDLTGTLAFKADPVGTGGAGSLATDEASLTFTEDWGTLKTGYFGWNNNVKDILDVWTGDIKTQTVINPSFAITDSVKLGIAYGFNGDALSSTASNIDVNPYGADLGYAADTFGADFLFYRYSEIKTAWGINAYIKLGDVKPFIQYRSFSQGSTTGTYTATNVGAKSYTVTNSIIGLTWDPADLPVYVRGEVDLSDKGVVTNSSTYIMDTWKYNCTPWGVRFGYKMSDGAKLEAQYKVTGYNDITLTGKSTDWSVKVIAAF